MGRTVTVTLGEHYDALVRTYVLSGRYTSVSEVIREGLRLLENSEGSLSKDRRGDREIVRRVDNRSLSAKACDWFNNREEIFERELDEIRREVIAQTRAEGKFEEADEAEKEWFGDRQK